ncbi:MAG TPA: GtrA family protein [Gammaproteobacteria bacterium]|nr:GtrA family protein [Gammaproteobacteria bacterium]
MINEALRQKLFFLIIGSSAFIIDCSITQFNVYYFKLNPWLARIPAIITSLLFTWHHNRTYTFKSKNPKSIREFIMYSSSTIITASINYGIYSALVGLSSLCYTHPILALAPATLLTMFINFNAYKYILSKPTETT